MPVMHILGSFSFFIKQLKIYTADSNGTQNTLTTCFPRFGEKYVENIPRFFIKYTSNKKHAVLKTIAYKKPCLRLGSRAFHIF